MKLEYLSYKMYDMYFKVLTLRNKFQSKFSSFGMILNIFCFDPLHLGPLFERGRDIGILKIKKNSKAVACGSKLT